MEPDYFNASDIPQALDYCVYCVPAFSYSTPFTLRAGSLHCCWKLGAGMVAGVTAQQKSFEGGWAELSFLYLVPGAQLK